MQKLKNLLVIFLKLVKGTRSKENINSEQSPQIWWKSLDTFPIKIFYKVLQTGDVSLLGNAPQKELNDNWADILDLYWKATDEIRYNQNIRKSVKLLLMQNEINVMVGAITLAEFGDKRGIEAMKHFNIDSIDRAIIRVRELKTKISLALVGIDKKDSKSEYNLYKDAVVIEHILGRSIDIDKCTVSYWIELNKLAKQISDGRNKASRHNRG